MRDSPTHFQLTITGNEKVGDRFFLLSFENPGVSFRPGQFAMVAISGEPYPLLRRPFAVSRTPEGTLQILYRVVGTGTRLMSYWKKGRKVNVIFPLGNGFEKIQNACILVGGGSGVASMIALARELHSRGTPYLLCVGTKKSGELDPHSSVFQNPPLNVKFATEDGSFGFHGTVLDLAEQHIHSFTCAAVCGPPAMMTAFLERFPDVNAMFSLENHMGCGTGVCLGCAIETRNGMMRVCVDGPVFPGKILLPEHLK